MRVPDLTLPNEVASLSFGNNNNNTNSYNLRTQNKLFKSGTDKILHEALKSSSSSASLVGQSQQTFFNGSDSTDMLITKRYHDEPFSRSTYLSDESNSNNTANNQQNNKFDAFNHVMQTNEDDYAGSPTTPLDSPSSLRAPLITRGIINPNYPGFQKFAHTLTDYYMAHHPAADCCYDSDTSDYDVKMADDCTNSNNNEPNYTEKRHLTSNDDAEEDALKPKNAWHNNNVFEKTSNTLTHIENFNDTNLSETETEFHAKHIPNLNISYEVHTSTPPDLLMKHTNLQKELKLTKHPDILCDVSTLCADVFKHKQVGLDGSGGTNGKNGVKEDVSLGLTPVDIIGDFGKEVEREFGLHVTGYKKDLDVTELEQQDKTAKSPVAETSNATGGANSLATEQKQSAAELPTIATKKSVIEESENTSGGVDAQKPNLNLELKSSEDLAKPKYHKYSYDERQLPPVIIDYKRCKHNQRCAKKSESGGGTHTKRNQGNGNTKQKAKCNQLDKHRATEEAEMCQYQEIVNNKESILRNSRYTKLPSWGQYLKNGDKDGQNKDANGVMSPSVLELFDAYRIRSDIDLEAFQNHFKLATEIEKKRKNDREKIRRRLAMEAEPNQSEHKAEQQRRSKIYTHFFEADFESVDTYENESDTESHSSDSETCPKLSKGQLNSSSVQFNNADNDEHLSSDNNKVEKCDFFTNQSRLQIEARMALGQAAEVARMQLKSEKQKQGISPITRIIRNTLNQVGVDIGTEKRRVSRQMLTEMNIAQLQVIVNSLHSHIAELNDNLVKLLLQRDDYQVTQDAILVDVEEISRFIVTREHMDSNNNY